MNVLMFGAVGNPSEVLRLEEIEDVKPAPGEVVL